MQKESALRTVSEHLFSRTFSRFTTDWTERKVVRSNWSWALAHKVRTEKWFWDSFEITQFQMSSKITRWNKLVWTGINWIKFWNRFPSWSLKLSKIKIWPLSKLFLIDPFFTKTYFIIIFIIFSRINSKKSEPEKLPDHKSNRFGQQCLYFFLQQTLSSELTYIKCERQQKWFKRQTTSCEQGSLQHG